MKYRVRITVEADIEAKGTADAIQTAGSAIRQGFDSLNQDSEYDLGTPHISQVYAGVPRKCLISDCENTRRHDDDYCDGHSR